MQFGMIGLGRMGAGMVRRLMRAGHKLVVFDRSADAVASLGKDGAVGSASLSEFISKLDKPRAFCIMVPAAYVDSTIVNCCPSWLRAIPSSTAATLTTTMTSHVRRRSPPRASTMWTWAPPAGSGAWSVATA